MPVTILSTAKPVATQLWRLGLINVWTRQSLAMRKPEGPFYSLTTHGVYRAEALMLARPRLTARPASYSELYADESTPALNERSNQLCAHSILIRPKTFRKCGLLEAHWTHGPETDILAGAPACSLWEPTAQNAAKP